MATTCCGNGMGWTLAIAVLLCCLTSHASGEASTAFMQRAPSMERAPRAPAVAVALARLAAPGTEPGLRKPMEPAPARLAPSPKPPAKPAAPSAESAPKPPAPRFPGPQFQRTTTEGAARPEGPSPERVARAPAVVRLLAPGTEARGIPERQPGGAIARCVITGTCGDGADGGTRK